jgi:hypothetical protein
VEKVADRVRREDRRDDPGRARAVAIAPPKIVENAAISVA